ncbi:MAG TPA: hypothetical protein VI341_06690 [Actinomycetota bacterium]
MTLLRRLLKINAALWVLWSLMVLVAPAWVIEDLLGQPPSPGYGWVRASAVMGLVLALLMVLVSQKLDELWWWSWAFAILEIGTATVFTLTALFGLPDGATAWPWLALAVINGGVGAGLLAGMGMAGQEKPFV